MQCREDYSIVSEETQSFEIGWGNVTTNPNASTPLENAYRYSSALKLNGLPVWGELQMYAGGGYVAELDSDPAVTSQLLADLRQNDWLDLYTRAVFVEYTIYNPSMNLFGYMNGMIEFPASGAAMPRPRLTTFQVYSIVGGVSAVILAFSILFVIVIVYFIVVEILRFRKMGKAYFKNPWCLLEVVLLSISVAAIAMYALREIWGRYITNKIHEDKGIPNA